MIRSFVASGAETTRVGVPSRTRARREPEKYIVAGRPPKTRCAAGIVAARPVDGEESIHSRRPELHLSLRAVDALHLHLERVAEPEHSAAAPTDERRRQWRRLEEVARKAASRQEAFEHVS